MIVDEIVMKEPYFEGINNDRDPVATFGKRVLLADDQTVSQEKIG